MTFLKAAAVMLTGRVFGAALGFSISLLVARSLPPEEFGAVVAAVAAVALLMRLASLGLGPSSQYWGATENRAATSYGRAIAVSAILPAMVLTAALWVAPLPFAVGLLGNELRAREVFLALMYAAPVGLLHFVLSTYLLGQRKVHAYQWVTNGPLLLTVAILIWVWLNGGGLSDVILAYQVQYGLAAVVALLVIVADRRPAAPLVESIRGMFGYALKSYLVFALAFTAGQVAVLVGAHFTEARELAYFTVARVWSEGIMVVYGAIGPLVLSYVGGMQGPESRRFIGPVARLAFLLFLTTGLLFALAAPVAVPLLYGQAYADTYILVLIVLPGLVVSGSQRILENFLYGRAKQGQMAAVHAATIGILVGSGALLIPHFGAVGLAWATTMSYFGSYLLTSWLLYRSEGIALHEHLLPRPSDLRWLIRRVWNRVAEQWTRS